MQIGELIHIVLGLLAPDRCPFCKDKSTSPTYTTYKGDTNKSGILGDLMKCPEELTNKQSGARPKDGNENRQSQDTAKPQPALDDSGEFTEPPIFRDDTTIYPALTGGPIGIYGNEAHHAISGNECMDGEEIEEIIKNDGSTYEHETGYSINNCANGVWLPSWNRRSGRWGSSSPDGDWGKLSDGLKFEIMKNAMERGAGQAHIGSHDDKTTVKHSDPYPRYVKRKLDAIKNRVESVSDDCPLCNEGNQKKKPMPTPYGVNLWLDNLSKRISLHLTSHPRKWRYFVSKYAAQYHDEVCRHGTIRGIPDNWPPT
jgi:hypothetical protein